jgi:hypothetical protein
LRVAGVTSAGTRADAALGDRAFDTRVDVYAAWIDKIIDPNPPPGDDHGDNLGDATVLDLSDDGAGSISGQIEVAGDPDVFRIRVPKSGKMTVWLRATGDLDPYLRVYNGKGVLLAVNNDFDGLDSRVRLKVTEGRTYFLHARGFKTTTGGYDVTLSM